MLKRTSATNVSCEVQCLHNVPFYGTDKRAFGTNYSNLVTNITTIPVTNTVADDEAPHTVRGCRRKLISNRGAHVIYKQSVRSS